MSALLIPSAGVAQSSFVLLNKTLATRLQSVPWTVLFLQHLAVLALGWVFLPILLRKKSEGKSNPSEENDSQTPTASFSGPNNYAATESAPTTKPAKSPVVVGSPASGVDAVTGEVIDAAGAGAVMVEFSDLRAEGASSSSKRAENTDDPTLPGEGPGEGVSSAGVSPQTSPSRPRSGLFWFLPRTSRGFLLLFGSASAQVLGMWSALRGLKLVSIPLYVVMRNSIPLQTALIERCLLRQQLSGLGYAGLFLTALGAVLYSFYDLRLSSAGLFFVFGNTLVSSCGTVLDRVVVRHMTLREKLSALESNHARVLISLPFFLAAAFVAGEEVIPVWGDSSNSLESGSAGALGTSANGGNTHNNHGANQITSRNGANSASSKAAGLGHGLAHSAMHLPFSPASLASALASQVLKGGLGAVAPFRTASLDRTSSAHFVDGHLQFASGQGFFSELGEGESTTGGTSSVGGGGGKDAASPGTNVGSAINKSTSSPSSWAGSSPFVLLLLSACALFAQGSLNFELQTRISAAGFQVVSTVFQLLTTLFSRFTHPDPIPLTCWLGYATSFAGIFMYVYFSKRKTCAERNDVPGAAE